MTANLVVGCGYLGGRVARLWLRQGSTVHGLTHHAAHVRHLRQQGISPLVGDWNDPQSFPMFPDVDTVLCSVGWDRTSGRTIHEVYVQGLENLLRALPDSVRRIVYVSSTGVYGDAQGQVVDEQSACRPDRPGARACLAAEQVLCHSPFANRAVILRLAGIYGPDRLPRLRELREALPLPADPDSLLNLIHVDDAANAVVAAARFSFPRLPGIVLVADGHAVARREFYAELARLLGLPAPRFVPKRALHGAARDGYGSKRVDNRYLVEQLAVTLRYPSYREGLAAIAGK